MTAKRTTRTNSPLCKFQFADARRCRMLRRDHPSLCPFHARAEQQLRESHQLGSEISRTLSGDFLTATDINFVLGKLFTAVAQNRIPRRNAAVLAYLGQLLLHSLSGVKQEFKFSYPFARWEEMLAKALPLSPPPSAPSPTPRITRRQAASSAAARPIVHSSAASAVPTIVDSSPVDPAAPELRATETDPDGFST